MHDKTEVRVSDRRRVLVLGGTGFIGKHVCAAFAEAGDDVLAAARRAAPGALPGVRVARLDAADGAAITALLRVERPDLVVNAAGAVWDLDERKVLFSNVTLVQRLVAALAAHPRPISLVHLGSSTEYGPQPRGVPLREDTPARPVSQYARGKLKATEVVLRAFEESGLGGSVLRLCQVIGPGQPAQSLLGRVADALTACESRAVELTLGSLRDERDVVDVRDVASAVVSAAEMAPGPRRVVNIGRGTAVSVRYLVERLIAIARVPATVHELEHSRATRSAGIAWEQTDVTAAREILGWTPRWPVDETLGALWRTAGTRLSSGHRGAFQPLTQH
ncbi:NAD-dependent epimerase/dehydratase family protein [Microtetraspora malaysiensis]|uniref:NAD-dependent epimerase/dehydratase family protein n=1 Tax=Microtetraspora malaysiensis TaxID=161358 RepID=UPI003D8EE9B7